MFGVRRMFECAVFSLYYQKRKRQNFKDEKNCAWLKSSLRSTHQYNIIEKDALIEPVFFLNKMDRRIFLWWTKKKLSITSLYYAFIILKSYWNHTFYYFWLSLWDNNNKIYPLRDKICMVRYHHLNYIGVR